MFLFDFPVRWWPQATDKRVTLYIHWSDPPLTTAQGPIRGPGSRAGVSYESSRVFPGRLREVVAPDSFIDTGWLNPKDLKDYLFITLLTIFTL